MKLISCLWPTRTLLLNVSTVCWLIFEVSQSGGRRNRGWFTALLRSSPVCWRTQKEVIFLQSPLYFIIFYILCIVVPHHIRRFHWTFLLPPATFPLSLRTGRSALPYLCGILCFYDDSMTSETFQSQYCGCSSALDQPAGKRENSHH